MRFRRLILPTLLLSTTNAQETLQTWAPQGISTEQFESHPAFDPLTGDFYFVRSRPDFSGWHILVSHCGNEGWTKPSAPPWAGNGQEADPWFTPDGKMLWFISNRSSEGVRRNDLDIWRITRDARNHWGTAKRLPLPVNSTANEWFPHLSADGWLYFGSGRSGGIGKTDIWRARERPDHSWRVENLGAPVNSPGNEFEALPLHDGKTLLVESDHGYFETHKTGTGWSAREYLPSTINLNRSEIGLAESPSGRTFMFARDTKGPKSGELFVWRHRGIEPWPPSCERK